MQFYQGPYYLSLLTADERAGVAFVLALVAASKPGSDLFKKAAIRIEKAIERKQKVNLEVKMAMLLKILIMKVKTILKWCTLRVVSARNHSKDVKKNCWFPCMV